MNNLLTVHTYDSLTLQNVFISAYTLKAVAYCPTKTDSNNYREPEVQKVVVKGFKVFQADWGYV